MPHTNTLSASTNSAITRSRTVLSSGVRGSSPLGIVGPFGRCDAGRTLPPVLATVEAHPIRRAVELLPTLHVGMLTGCVILDGRTFIHHRTSPSAGASLFWTSRYPRASPTANGLVSFSSA